MKNYKKVNVLDAARKRISFVFDEFEKVYLSFSGGKDSTVMLHLVMDEAIKRGRKIGLLFIDLEAQYNETINHIEKCFDMYSDHIEPFWISEHLNLRNAVSCFEPFWGCWEEGKEWVRGKNKRSYKNKLSFHFPGMEFEEFMVEFGNWYGGANFVGIRSDESLDRFRAVSSEGYKNCKWSSKSGDIYSFYPIYDWKFSDIWKYHKLTGKPHNRLYDLMLMAGCKYGNMRICQPYGDEQKKGLWLYHVIEPDTWAKVVSRVAGANTVDLIENKIEKPENMTWKLFAESLILTMPEKTKKHYKSLVKNFILKWKSRGYPDGIEDFIDSDLERRKLAPSWRMIAKAVLRNDYHFKTIGMSISPKHGFKYINSYREEKLLAKNGQLSLLLE